MFKSRHMLPFFFMMGFATLALLPSCIFAEEKEEKPAEAVAAGTASGVSIAVVDVQSLLNDSAAALDVKKQAAELRDSYQKEFEELEKNLRGMEKDFVAQKDKLNEEQIVAKRKEFEKQLIDAQMQVKKRKKQLEEAVGKATSELRSKILEIVATMSTQRGFQLVISRNDVVIVSSELDITREVMDELNNDLKTIKLDIK